MNFKNLILSIFVFSSISIFSTENLVQEKMLQELKILKQSMEIKYAPKEWKKDHLNWSLNKSYQKAKEKIESNENLSYKSFQKIIKDFLGTTSDYHVGIQFYSTAQAFFPIQIKSAKNRYFFTGINQNTDSLSIVDYEEFDFDKMIEEISQLTPGDEVIAINGTPIRNEIEKLIDENLFGIRNNTNYSLAEKMLLIRRGTKANEIPTGTFTLTFLHSGKEKTITLPWIWSKEMINEPAEENRSFFSEKQLFKKPIKVASEIIKKSFAKDYSVALAKEIKAIQCNKLSSDNKSDSKEEQVDLREKGFLPPLGKVLWESEIDKNLFAYLYKNSSGQKIGYLYLADFIPEDDDEMIDQIINALTIFEKEAEALVFDLTDNPGGDLLFGYAVLSTLTDYPLICPTQKEKLIPEDIYEYVIIRKYLELIENKLNEEDKSTDEKPETLSGLRFTPKLIEGFKDYIHNTINYWESGIKFTPDQYVLGINEIEPHPIMQFNKPIMLLINELDFSCGDFIPAVLQDNQRAVLFGKKTAGAGGYVKSYSHMSNFGIIGYTLTGSIATRVNGKVIENLGVSPDIPYELSIKDLKDNYSDYIRTLNSEVKKLINQKQKEK